MQLVKNGAESSRDCLRLGIPASHCRDVECHPQCVSASVFKLKVLPGVYMPRILGRLLRSNGSRSSSNIKNQLRDMHLISLKHRKTTIQNAMLRFMSDGIRWRLKLFRLRAEQSW
jgi:hypothetical protein